MFQKKHKTILTATDIPSGICVEAGGERYYINKKYRHLIPSKRVFESWSFPFVVEVSPEVLSSFKKARPLGFRDGTLVKSISDGKLYLISQRQKCIVANPDFFAATGIKKVVFVSDKELALHADGEVIN